MIEKGKRSQTFVMLGLYLVITLSCEPKIVQDKQEQERWWTEADREYVLSELDRTTNELEKQIGTLTDPQWNFREDTSRWSIAEIVEHLEMQNQLHYREISVVSQAPQMLEYRSITKGKDDHFISYGTDTTRSNARWFLTPKGKFCSQSDGKNAFFKARSELRSLVKGTTIDFRKQFTFRTNANSSEISELKIGEVRDLHQLLLTGIAHTDRHILQVKNLKRHKDYPAPGQSGL